MKTTWVTMTASFALIAGSAMAEEVRVYNWSDYIDEELLTKFEEETGIDLIYDVFDSNEVLETKMLAGGSGYDVVVPTGTFLQRQIQAGAFQPLDKSQLPNIDNMWDVVTKRTDVYDPGQEYAINYMWGTTGIGVNVDKVKEALGDDVPMNSWDLVFDPANMEKLASCGVAFLDAPAEIIPSALFYLGLDPNSTKSEDYDAAVAMMSKIQPYVRYFNSSRFLNDIANGEICVAVAWSGSILQANSRAQEANNGVHLEYRIPKEGAQVWFDLMAIPKDAPNPAAAHAFINYLLDPQIQVLEFNSHGYATGDSRVEALLPPETADNKILFPAKELMDGLEFGAAETLTDPIRAEVIARFKSA